MALGLLSQTLLWFLAPRRNGTRPSVSGARPQPVVKRPFFDYPDSDRASLLAVARFIGEKPITFVKTGMNQLDRGASLLAGSGRTLALVHCLADSRPGLFQHILVGTLVVAFFFLLFQFCLHV